MVNTSKLWSHHDDDDDDDALQMAGEESIANGFIQSLRDTEDKTAQDFLQTWVIYWYLAFSEVHFDMCCMITGNIVKFLHFWIVTTTTTLV